MSFGIPPGPDAVKLHFPGISARRFDAVGATACYRTNIKAEQAARAKGMAAEAGAEEARSLSSIRLADTFADMMPGLATINTTCAKRGWSKDLLTGRRLPPGEEGEPLQALNKMARSMSSSHAEGFRADSQIHGLGAGGSLVRRPPQSGQRYLPSGPSIAAPPEGSEGSATAYEWAKRMRPEFYAARHAPKPASWNPNPGGSNSTFLAQQAHAQLIRQRSQPRGGIGSTFC
eukprot:TRINITY_DN110478_c0_g1_i1.p1 TRINITY_DN110478_c0_g1~~TRINITY_DN110478_c0_g1_i1.p1  ORF type:complete len:248 (+),score=33.47 TRINITY_DN110478_c0_g1_i1:52-744(+)